jgi:hydrogenase nickel incorporation protein HypB
MKVSVLKNVMGANEALAARNRELLDRSGVFAIDLMSSPGAGKTSLIIETVRVLKSKLRIGVIEGDIASTIDSDRVRKEGVKVLQINVGAECSLDANMVGQGLAKLPLKDFDLLFIENVGNLICPAEFTLGEHRRVVVLSLPEGDDKPVKYPLMFTKSDCVLLNKIDLAPHLEFNTAKVKTAIRGLNPGVKIFEISCKTGRGVRGWCDWLVKERQGIAR